MKIYDISRGFFSAKPYEDDPKAIFETIKNIDNDGYKLSLVSAVVHTSTHADAPSHFLSNEESIDKMPLELFIGVCSVVTVNSKLTAEDIKEILLNSRKRLLLKGKPSAFLTAEAAEFVDKERLLLIGTEANSIADGNETAIVHKTIMKKGIAILENLDLSMVEDGDYFLFAPPIKMEGLEGAPVRAVLLQSDWS